MNPKLTARKNRHRRIRAKIEGSHERPRLVVFRSLKYNYAQLIDDEKNRVIASASDMKKRKEKKAESAKKIGLILAKKALEKGIKRCIFDRNGYQYHGRVKAIAEGAREGGLGF